MVNPEKPDKLNPERQPGSVVIHESRRHEMEGPADDSTKAVAKIRKVGLPGLRATSNQTINKKWTSYKVKSYSARLWSNRWNHRSN